MKIIPQLTEKSLGQAKKGHYTFWVDKGFNKPQIKKAVEKVFGVHVTKVHTINLRGGQKRNLKGRLQSIKDRKKAVVSLKADEKIDLFEEKKQ